MRNNLLFESIVKNPNLTNELKGNLKDLAEIYNVYFPKENPVLAKNIQNLEVEEANKFLLNVPLKYQNNKLFINSSEIENYDYRYLLMRELIKMSASNDKYNALYEGVASLSANMMVGNEGPKLIFEDEEIAINLLSNVVGIDCLLDLTIYNNEMPLFNELKKLRIDLKDFQILISKMNYNMEARHIDRNQSMIGQIQLDILNLFLKKDRSLEEIKNFKKELFLNPNIFEKKEKYQNLKNYQNGFNNIINNIELQSTTKVR